MALVDGDPSGLSILSTYMNGSAAMQHESDNLAAGERIKWIGIRLSELPRWVSISTHFAIQGLIGDQIRSRQRLALAHHDP